MATDDTRRKRIRELERELAELKGQGERSSAGSEADPDPARPARSHQETPHQETLHQETLEQREERRRAREALIAAKTQADLANRTKSEFLARMSHDIRTPMNAIIGLGHLLRDTPLNDQQRSYLDSMSAAADSLLHIINQVLDFSKIETGRIVLENAHFDLEQVFEKLSRLFEVSAIHHHVDITYDLHADVPRFLRGDTARLGQILSHLVNNALRYSTSCQILLSVRRERVSGEGVQLRFSITDFGVGMSPEQLNELQSSFNAIAAGELPETADGMPASTGLTICYHLIRLMHGRLDIDSEPGKGCRISFTAWFEHSQIGAKTLKEDPSRFENLRALVVDDNALAREIIGRTLQSMHIGADAADSARGALARIREAERRGQPYDLVLMDYQMPETNGLEATAQLKAEHQLRHSPRVLLISSYQRDEIFKDHQNAELVDGFLNKPVSESRLFDALCQLFSGRLLNREDAPVLSEAEALNGLRVLLAEDNRVNQQVAQGILAKRGVQVTLAGDGREALDTYYRDVDAFDVILMDLEMPNVDGYEATRRIRSGRRRPDIPIVALTAQALRGDRERCLAEGMNDYISKPIKPALLYRTLARLVQSAPADNGE